MSQDSMPPHEVSDPFAELAGEEARILPPDFTLKKIIGEDVDVRQIFSPENIEKAQSVINEHQSSFLEWVAKDIAQLEELYKAAANPAEREAAIHKLARTAFVIKSQAGTFGFQLATQVAKSLDDFCTRHPHPAAEQMTVIRKHIDTLSVIFLKNIAGDGGQLGRELTETLHKLVTKFRTA